MEPDERRGLHAIVGAGDGVVAVVALHGRRHSMGTSEEAEGSVLPAPITVPHLIPVGKQMRHDYCTFNPGGHSGFSTCSETGTCATSSVRSATCSSNVNSSCTHLNISIRLSRHPSA